MSTDLSEADVEDFLSNLKDADIDKKVNLIQLWGLKLEKATSLPAHSFDALTLTVSPFLRSTSHLLVTSMLTSFLPFYLTLLPTSPPSTSIPALRLALSQILIPLLERLNDPKDRVHAPAATCVAILGTKSYEADSTAGLASSGTTAASSHTGSGVGGTKGKEKEGLASIWEAAVKETLSGKATRAKVEILKLLVLLRAETTKIPLKPWLPSLVDLLEDSDGNVRDQARESVVALLSPATTPPAARSELKRLLLTRGVRKTISDNIIHRIFGGGDMVTPTGKSTPTLDTAFAIPLGEETATSRARNGTVLAGAGAINESSSAGTAAADEVEVVYIASVRDLENEFASMAPHFEGKETELNWAPREKSLVRIRGMLRGQAFVQFPDAFMPSFKANVLEGVAKTLLSLRTTVAQQACALVQELAEYTGSAFDPCVDHLLPVLGKMAGFTKKIVAEKSQKSVTAIFTHTTAPPKLLIAHITAAVSDKNVQTRQYGFNHLRTFCSIQGVRAKSIIDSTPYVLEQIEGVLKKGLADMNPQVRELARLAFWGYESVWNARGQALMGELDGMTRKQLERANPKDQASGGSAGAGKPTAITTTTTGQKPRQTSASNAILAMKRAKAAEMANARASASVEISTIPGSPSIPASEKKATEKASGSASASSSPIHSVSASASSNPQPPVSSKSSPGISLSRSSVVLPTGSPILSSRTVTRPTPSSTPRHTSLSSLTSPRDPFGASQRSRSSSLARTVSHSPPPSSKDSPTSKNSPLKHTSAFPPDSIRSTASSSATSNNATSNATSLRTPVQARHVLPTQYTQSPQMTGVSGAGGEGYYSNGRVRVAPGTRGSTGGSVTADESRIDIAVWSQSVTPDRPTTSVSGVLANDPVEEARRAQAAQAISAAQQLLEFTHEGQPSAPVAPITPVRPSGSSNGLGGTVGNIGTVGVDFGVGGHPYGVRTPGLRTPRFRSPGLRTPGLRTPNTNNGSWEPWQDSPMTMSPRILSDLKARNSERSWWNKRKQYISAATPLKSLPLSTASALEPDIVSLKSGSSSIESMNRLVVFSQKHKITLPSEVVDEETLAEEKEIWENGGLFERMFEALMSFLQPDQTVGILERGLILLWEMIENQWILVEGHEEALCDALFRLRACDNGVVLEATNAIIFLLLDVLDLHLLLTTLRIALEKFMSLHANDLGPTTPSTPSMSSSSSITATNSILISPRGAPTVDDDPNAIHVMHGKSARQSALTFGLSAMGFCVLGFSREIIEREARLFEPLVMTALRMEDSVPARQAGQRLILTVQCVLKDDARTLSLFPSLDSHQRNMCTYLMKTNKILGNGTRGSGSTGTPSIKLSKNETLGIEGGHGGGGDDGGDGRDGGGDGGDGDGWGDEEEGKSLIYDELIQSITKSAKPKRENKE